MYVHDIIIKVIWLKLVINNRLLNLISEVMFIIYSTIVFKYLSNVNTKKRFIRDVIL